MFDMFRVDSVLPQRGRRDAQSSKLNSESRSRARAPWLSRRPAAGRFQLGGTARRRAADRIPGRCAHPSFHQHNPILASAETIGSALFPKAAPGLKVIAGAIGAFDPNVTKWLQDALNKLVKTSPKLDVDGIYGPETVAAVEALQQKLGLKVDGLAGQLTQAAIIAELGKLH
jgi:murein L,D-transpeptidase YcbB/YkuD